VGRARGMGRSSTVRVGAELLGEQHLLLAVGHGLATENPSNHRVREVRLLVHELEHATVRELAVVGVQPPGLV
jgi:hypothetical protein